MNTIDADAILARATPAAPQQRHEIQPLDYLVKVPIALAHATCAQSGENLNQLLADTSTLRDLYRSHQLDGTDSRSNVRGPFVAADRDQGTGRVDAVAGSEFIDDRIRLRE